MGAPKGSRNAAAYQKLVTDDLARRVEIALAELKRSNASFTNVTGLSRHIAGRVGSSAVTLRRNIRYRSMIDNYLTAQKGAAGTLPASCQDVAVARAKLRVLEIELSVRDRTIQRLRAALMKSGLPETSKTNTGRIERGCPDDFIRTCHLVVALLGWMPDLIVDHRRRAIIDNLRVPGEDVVASESLADPFIRWREREH